MEIGRKRSAKLSAGKSSLSLSMPATASALAMIMAFSANAQDQTSQQSSSSRSSAPRNDVLEEVVVTGIRASLESAQAIKQNALEIVDSVTAQDIGALPDRSVSEALQRIPGVTLQRTSANRDPARLASEGGGVFIRGLSWVRSETNGRDVFSANNGRDLSFEDVSADLLSGIDVYKNPSAEQIEGGIGGIVNLRTRLPFDSSQQLLALSGDYNYADLLEKGFVSGNALFSDQWDAGEGRIGALISASIGNIGNRTDSIQSGRYEPQVLTAEQAQVVGLPAGSTVYMPNSLGARTIEWEQERRSFSAAFQWAPSDVLTFTLQGLHARANPTDLERTLGDTEGGFAMDPSYVFDDQGVLVAGTIPNTRPTTNTRYGEQKKETTDLSFNVQYALNDSWALTGDLQFIESHAEVTSLTAFSQLGGAPLGTMDFDLRGDDPSMRLNNSAQDDPNAYWWAAAMDHLEDNDATSKAARLDAEYAFNDNPWLHSFQVGVRATDREAVTRQTGWNWGYLSQQFWCIGCGAPAFLGSGPAGTAEMFTFDNFFRGDVGRPGVAWTPSANLVKSGRNNAYELLRATQGAGWGWVPLTGEYDNLQLHADNGNRGINDQTERTEAAYAMIRFENDGWRVPIDGNVGVRAVHTDTSTLATPGVQARAGNSTTTNDPNAACDPSAEDCTWWNNATSFVGAFGSLQNAAVDSSYTDVLPTMNLRFLLQPELQLRFAAGKAIVRPTFSQMQGSTLLTFDNTGFQPTAGVANDGMVGYGGNPNLKPTRATQFDTSLEWYFAPTGSATFAMFFKDVRDYIFAGQGLETYSAGGQEVEFLVTRNMNGAKGRIRGFEAAYQQFYDWLPGPLNGLGFQANFTYVDSSGGKNAAVTVLDANQVAGANNEELPLEGLSRTSYNVALLYEKSAVSARLAYNWRERYLLTTSAANINRPVWFEDFGQLDGSVFYSITPNVKLGLQGTNLLNTRTFLDVGGTTLAPRYSWTDTDRKIAVAIRTSF